MASDIPIGVLALRDFYQREDPQRCHCDYNQEDTHVRTFNEIIIVANVVGVSWTKGLKPKTPFFARLKATNSGAFETGGTAPLIRVGIQIIDAKRDFATKSTREDYSAQSRQ